MIKTLQPLKKVSKKKLFDFLTIDIETENWIEFICSGVYDLSNNRYREYDKIDECLDDTFEYAFKKKIDTIYAHFGGKFDFSFFLKYFLLDSDRYEVSTIIPRGASILCFSVKINDSINDKYFIKKGKKSVPFMLHFWDSSALVPFGLASLAKSFQVETLKGEIDYAFLGEAWRNENYISKLFEREYIYKNESIKKYEVYYNGKRIKKYNSKKHTDTDLITYIDKDDNNKEHIIYNKKHVQDYQKDDCKALAQVLYKFYNWPLVKKAGPSKTVASQAVKVWRTYMSTSIYSLDDKVDEFVRRGYFGGRTEIFKSYFDCTENAIKNLPSKWQKNKEVKKNIKKQSKHKKMSMLDVNSLYPTVMMRNDYPSRFSHWEYNEKRYNKNQIAFWEATVFVPEDIYCPPLGINYTLKEGTGKGTTKLVFPTGRFYGVWSTHELEYAKSIGVKVLSLGAGAIFKNGGRIFETYIEDMYKKRLKAKRENDGVTNMMTKLMMNSTYGKLGMNLVRSNLVIDDGSEGLAFHSEIENNEGRKIRFMEQSITLDDSFTNVAIPAMVTSYARVHMHKLYMKGGEEHLYYTDTDSIFVTNPEDFADIMGDGLGMLDEEYSCKSACFILPKTYSIEGIEGAGFRDKMAMKGFTKKQMRNFTFNDFASHLSGELGLLKTVQVPKFATFKTALKKGRMVTMNFDPEIEKSTDKDKQKAFDATNRAMKASLSPEEYNEWYKSQKKKNFVKDSYKISKREIKSLYDKRIMFDFGFDSKPIHLNEN